VDNFLTAHVPFIKFNLVQMNRQTAKSNSRLQDPARHALHRRWDYSKNEVPDLNVIIPVYGRKDHLSQSLRCLLEQANSSDLSGCGIEITVCEMSKSSQHADFCVSEGAQYLFLQGEVFNKSEAMNTAANLFPAKNFIFYDVDILVAEGWLKSCIDTIKSIRGSGSNCWISQPIPERKIFYVSEKDTSELFAGNKKIFDMSDDSHFIQPEWYKGNYPPGGIVMITAELLYAVQGYDPHLFWGYSPEDLLFLERCVSYSDSGQLTCWQSGPSVYHLHHDNSENSNMSYEHMVYAANVLRSTPGLSRWYSHSKLQQTREFTMWQNEAIKWGELSGCFPNPLGEIDIKSLGTKNRAALKVISEYVDYTNEYSKYMGTGE